MNINGFEFGENIDNLYNEIVKLNPHHKIEIVIKDGIKIKNAYGFYDANNESDKIEIEKSHASEDIVSHELLHCYLYRKGFTKVRTYAPKGDLIEYFAANVENNLMHKLIYEEQKRRNINNLDSQIEYANKLGTNIAREPDNFPSQIRFSMKILDAEMRCLDCKELYTYRMETNFGNSYKYAQRIYKAAMKYDFQKPFEFRRALIRALKEIDNIAEENGFPRLNLNYNVGVDFIPSQNQLKQYLDQLFVLYRNVGLDQGAKEIKCMLFSKSENQLCYFIETDDIEGFEKKMASVTLKEFYNITGYKYITR